MSFNDYLFEFDGLCDLLRGHEAMGGVDLAGVVGAFVEGLYGIRRQAGLSMMPDLTARELECLAGVGVGVQLYLSILEEYVRYCLGMVNRALAGGTDA